MTAHPEVLVQLRDELVADAEGFNDHRRQYKIIRNGLDVKVRRSPQAVACRKRCTQELGRPLSLPDLHRGRISEPCKGKVTDGLWGILSGIVLRAWESHVHGEGPDGSTQPAKETCTGHVGSEHCKQTSLRGMANKAKAVHLARKRVQPRNRMRENFMSGTVRGVPGNRHSYRGGLK